MSKESQKFNQGDGNIRKCFELLKSDGYKIYTNEEFEALPKPESIFAFLNKDYYKDEKQHNS